MSRWAGSAGDAVCTGPGPGARCGQSPAAAQRVPRARPRLLRRARPMCATSALSLDRSALGQGFTEAVVVPHTGCAGLQTGVLSVLSILV